MTEGLHTLDICHILVLHTSAQFPIVSDVVQTELPPHQCFSFLRLDYAVRREYEWITPPSFEVQTMSVTQTVVASSGNAVKSGGSDRGKSEVVPRCNGGSRLGIHDRDVLHQQKGRSTTATGGLGLSSLLLPTSCRSIFPQIFSSV